MHAAPKVVSGWMGWAALAVALTLGAGLARADVHRFEDGRGVVHLTNLRPAAGGLKVTRVRVPRASADAVAPSCDGPTPWEGLIDGAAQAHGLPASLIKATIRAESGFDPAAVSRAGALGLMQLMPATASRLGVGDPKDPAQNIDGGARYLRQLLDAYDGDVPTALAAYNAGPPAVARHGGVPPFEETAAFVERVQRFARCYEARR